MINHVKEYCENILTTTRCKNLPFHNLEHTQEVVNNVKLIGTNSGFTTESLEPVIIAAWFHDVGFCDTYKGHEEVSIRLAIDFLKGNGYSSDKIEILKTCIEATKIPQNPKSKYSKILSDADILHISTDNFFYRKLLLRREWEVELNQFSTDLEWHLLNLKFLENHTFFTKYGKEVLKKGQLRNELKVKKLIELYKDEKWGF